MHWIFAQKFVLHPMASFFNFPSTPVTVPAEEMDTKLLVLQH